MNDENSDDIIYTEGPWVYKDSGAFVLAKDGQMTVADIRGFGKLEKDFGLSKAIKIMDGNGRLIAESPEMLKIVKIVANATGDTDLEEAQELAQSILKRLRNSKQKTEDENVANQEVVQLSGYPLELGWVPHRPQTWSTPFAKLRKPLTMTHYTDRWEDGCRVTEDVECEAGQQVKIVMVSRLGDVGITHDLQEDSNYGARVMLDDLCDFTQSIG